MPLRECRDTASFGTLSDDGTTYRGNDGQVGRWFSGPDGAEMHRVMAEHLQARGWVCIGPGWLSRALRGFVVRTLGI
jgi:hypothetical protein